MNAEVKLAFLESLFNGDVMVAAVEGGTFVLDVLEFDDTTSFYVVSVDDDGKIHDLRSLSGPMEIPLPGADVWVPVWRDDKYEWTLLGGRWSDLYDSVSCVTQG
jgi:hypothetical protein